MGILEGKNVLVFDRGGIFTHVAEVLAEYCSNPLMYYSEWREAFSSSAKRMPGVGLNNVLRVDDFFQYVQYADLVVFPDIGDGSLQEYLRGHHHLVWGSGVADRIETDKIDFNLWLAQSGLAAPEMFLIEGTDALEEFLRNPENDGMWLKSNDRGDLETRKHETWLESEQWFYGLLKQLGPNRRLIKVIAQKPIEAEDEIGYDGYMIDGQFAAKGIIGWEAKDAMYVGKVVNEFPKSVATINAVEGARCAGLGYRGFFSTEVREAEDGSFYFIDPTHRAGSPPSEAMMRWYKNWDEIMYHGAMGHVIEPEPVAPYGAEVILKSSLMSDFLPVHVDEKHAKNVLLHWHCRMDDVDYIIPKDIEEFGAAVGYGNSARDALENALEAAHGVKCEGFKIDEKAMDDLLEIVDNYKEK